jgi:tetratricopeptide (TPR) repeat protein
MTLPKIDDDARVAAFNRGNHFRRTGEFDKALQVYEKIVEEDPNDAEAHWCCALCRFGIEWVEDPATLEYLPTCHRASFDPFTEDVDCKAAIELSDGRIVTGRNSDEMHAAAAMVMNAVKTLAGIPAQIPLIGPNIIHSIAHMKQDILKVGYTSLNVDEVLIGLAISATTNPAAQIAMEKLNELRSCEVHMTHIVTPGDEAGLRRLGCRFTSDPYYATNALFTGEK